MGVKGRWARLFIGAVDLSTKTSNAELALAVATEEVTAWQDTAKAYITAGVDSSLTINGYVSALADDAGGMEQALAEALGNGVQVGVLLHEESGAEVGMPVYVFPSAQESDMSIAAPATGVLTIDGGLNGGEGGWRRGLLIYRGAITATGTKTAIDFGAAGSAGGDAFLWVQSITGTATDAVINLASASTQAGTYNNEATFQFDAVGGYSAVMTGAIDRWLRINTTDMGGATAFTVVIVACVDGVTQPNY